MWVTGSIMLRFTTPWLIFLWFRDLFETLRCGCEDSWTKNVGGRIDEGDNNLCHEGNQETGTKELWRKRNLLYVSIYFVAAFCGEHSTLRNSVGCVFHTIEASFVLHFMTLFYLEVLLTAMEIYEVKRTFLKTVVKQSGESFSRLEKCVWKISIVLHYIKLRAFLKYFRLCKKMYTT